MKLFSIVSTTLLLFVLGASISVFAQEQRDEPRPQAQEEEKRDDAHARQEEDRAKHEEKQEVRHDEAVKHDEHHEEVHRIPDDRFRAHFGPSHHFRIGHPVIVAGQPRFNYGGYWFVFAQPWPAGWSYNDDVYVDFIDGTYFLIDPVHPGVRLSINVVL